MALRNKNYTPTEKTGLFMKFKDGVNKIRILSEIETGYVYWTKEADGTRKPHRFLEQPKSVPHNIDGAIKDTWVMAVWNYNDAAIQVLEITQATIYDALYTLERRS
jgi:hypothetical protein